MPSASRPTAAWRPETDSQMVRLYNKRSTAEHWIKEGKQAMKMTRQSCHRFRSNAERDCLQPGEPLAAAGPLTSLQQHLVKTGGRLVKHARYYWLLLAESHLTRRLFQAMVRPIRVAALAGRVDERATGRI